MTRTDRDEGRFDRNERLFGKDGQAAIRATHVVLVGAGGLGTHVAQQLALLGVAAITSVDFEELSKSNRNRYIGAWASDPIPGLRKVDLVARMVGLIDPTISVRPVHTPFPSSDSLAALGVRPSNRRDGHTTSCCALTTSVAICGDGGVGVGDLPEREARCCLCISCTGDTA